MRIARLISVLAVVATALVAASPYVGTWKLDPAKSKYKTGSAPKEQTVAISESAGDLHVVVKGVASNGTPISSHTVVPAAGGAGKIVESTAYDGVSNKRVSESERETSYSKGGKVIYTVHSKVSADGKTLTTHAKGMTAAGQMVEGTNVYSKQ
jgi:hypothetical protein